MAGRAPAAAGLFVTATDTDAGKTVVCAGIMHALQSRGYRVHAMKPVAAGCTATAGGLRNDDALRLQAQSSTKLEYTVVNPVALADPIAPHIAAAEAGVSIRTEDLALVYRRAAARADFCIVEGAGGWLVPLNRRQTMADLAEALGLPVVLVANIRLGVINHALLSAESITARGVPFLGWIANRSSSSVPRFDENVAAIAARINAPLLGVVPYLGEPSARRVAPLLEPLADRLCAVLGHPEGRK